MNFLREQKITIVTSIHALRGTTGVNPEGLIECFPESDFDHAKQNNVTDFFSIFIDPEVVFDDDKSEFRCQNYLRRKNIF